MRIKKRSLLTGLVSGNFAYRSRRIRPRIIIGSTLLLAIPLVATTFASQVTIQGAHGGAIEFGQGNQKTIVCDQYIQTAVGESWYTSPSPDFYVDKIFLTNLDVNSLFLNSATSNQGCGSKTLKVGLYNLSDSPAIIGADSSTVVSFTVPSVDQSISSLSGNLGGSHNITASLFNSSEAVTAVTKSGNTLTYTYTPTSYATTYPLAVGDYVTISGTTGCDYAGAHISAIGSGTFTIDGITTTGCANATGLAAKVYGKGVIQLNLPASTIQLAATSVGRVSLESN
jgi:hypothetical protein